MIATITRTTTIFLAFALTSCSDGVDSVNSDSGTSPTSMTDASSTNVSVESVSSPPDSGTVNDTDGADIIDDTTGDSSSIESPVSIDPPTITVDNTAFIGTINIQTGGNMHGSLTASFAQLPSIATATVLSEIDKLTQQGCIVEDNADINLEPESFPEFRDFGFQLISAGESIVFTGPNGTYIEMRRQSAGGITFYTTDEDISQLGPIPSNLIVDFPGDVFPGFSNVIIPDTDPLIELSSNIADATSTDADLTWNAGSNPDAVVSFSTSLVDSQTGQTVNVHCTTADDGEFSIPSDIQSGLGSDLQGVTNISRLAIRVFQRDNAALFVIRQYYR